MISDLTIKRGASLNVTLEFWAVEGQPTDVGAMTITGQVRTPDDTFVANLTMVKQPEIGIVTFSVPNTSQWPTGRLRWDLRVVSGGVAIYSDTLGIVVNRQVTQI